MPRPRTFDEAKVVEQATQVFWAKGYRRTTPKDLLAATGLSKSSLYATFESKDGLFLRALDRYVAFNQAMVGQLLAGGTLRAALERLYTQVVAMAHEDGGRSCLVCSAALEVDPADADLVAQIAQAADRMTQVFEARIAQAQRDGQVPADRDPAVLAAFIQNANMGLVVQARAGASPDAMWAIAHEVIRAVCGPPDPN